jgi:hypothetical protein
MYLKLISILLLFISSTSVKSNVKQYYNVPFSCSVKAGLGCGSAAKYVMSKLYEYNEIDSLWLNYSGDILAIKWENETDDNKKTKILEKGFIGWNLVPKQLSSVNLDSLSKVKWYEGYSVDSLSYEEAQENVNFIFNIIKKKYTYNKTDSIHLRDDLFNFYKNELVKIKLRTDLSKWNKKLNNILAIHLSKQNYKNILFYK